MLSLSKQERALLRFPEVSLISLLRQIQGNGVPGLFNPYPLNNFSLLTLRQAFFVKLGTGRMNGLERLS
ncbi:MAG: hypothetical protein LBD67_06070, partial [Candidatus Accumulibacter sp.]|nr:hypothetical protein [Accumulibacter sp.]